MCGEGFVDFVVVEVLQAQAITCQQPWHRVDRRHQQPFGAVDEIHRRRFTVAPIRKDRQAARLRPLFTGQQHHRGAVGQRCRITRGQGALGAFFEGWFQPGQFFQGHVRAQVVVAGQAQKWRQQILVPALSVGCSQFLMALKGQLILLGARNAPGLCHQLAVLAHGQTGTRLTVTRKLGDQMPGTQLQEGFQLVARGFPAVGLQQNPAQAFTDADRCIRRGIDAASNAAVDLPQGNFVRHQ
ncbi:hypothetical protein D3C71_1475290 [compost metagenome]